MMFITVNDKEEFEVARKAVQDLREQRKKEAEEAKARATELIVNAVDEALTLVEPEEITDVLHNLYLTVNDMIDIH